MPGRVPGLSRVRRCAIMLRATRAAGARRPCPRCCYCDRGVIPRAQVGERRYALAAATVDHVVPQALGGATAPDNLVLACWECNARWRDSPKPAWALARAAAELAVPLDEGAEARAMARELYPRPRYSQSASVDSQSKGVNACLR